MILDITISFYEIPQVVGFKDIRKKLVLQREPLKVIYPFF